MKKKQIDTIEQFEHLFNLPESFSVSDIRSYFERHFSRRISDKSAIKEIDQKLGNLNNLLLSLTMFFKLYYLFTPNATNAPTQQAVFTKQEVAVKYRVSVRTINNWIASGPKTIEIGGVLRISEDDLNQFSKGTARKRLKWKSTQR